jgi:hypothetical protein
MRRLLLLAALLLFLAVPAQANAAKYLWATVNVCDTPKAPNTVGVRGSMPGNGTRQRLYMRFEAQYFDELKDRFVSTGSRTRWMRVGSARFKSTQAGFSFAFTDPPAGSEFRMRGIVGYQWRARRKGRLVVVKRARRITRGGVRGVEGGDPRGFSAASCVIRP